MQGIGRAIFKGCWALGLGVTGLGLRGSQLSCSIKIEKTKKKKRFANARAEMYPFCVSSAQG